jgi:Major Facilitator Superfamily
LSRIGISSIFFLAPLLFQDGLGKTPLESGMLFLPYALAMFPVRFFVTPLVKRLGFRHILVWNTFILGILIASLGLVQVNTSTAILVLGMIAIGALTSLQYGCLSVITYIDLPSNAKSSGATVASICQQLSIELGIGLATLVFVLLSPDTMLQPFSITSFKQSIVVMGALTAFASFIFTGLWKTDGVGVVDDKPTSRIESSEDYKIAR